MKAHTKKLLNVSGIASRNDGVHLARAGKYRRDALWSKWICQSNHTTRQSDILTLSQKQCPYFGCAPLVSVRIALR